ncbi:hypothetical protein BU17DRAFT_88188 [Hysterangium stoloniferum]|nr:hypothetical protein BU17DRAFT_88188 [Hysterangium stoloniferum]
MAKQMGSPEAATIVSAGNYLYQPSRVANDSAFSCSRWEQFLFALQILARTAILVVFIARTFAITHCSLRIALLLVALAVVILVVEFNHIYPAPRRTSMGKRNDLQLFIPTESYVIDFFIGAVASAISRLVFDTIVVGITLHRTIGVIITLQGSMDSLTNGGTINLILTNGLFYFVIVVLAESTVVIFAFIPEVYVKTIADPIPLILACSVISRFILDLKEQDAVRTRILTEKAETASIEFASNRVLQLSSRVTADFGDPVLMLGHRPESMLLVNLNDLVYIDTSRLDLIPESFDMDVEYGGRN